MRHWQKFHDSHQRLNDWLKETERKVTTLKTDGATFSVIKEAIRNIEVCHVEMYEHMYLGTIHCCFPTCASSPLST